MLGNTIGLNGGRNVRPRRGNGIYIGSADNTVGGTTAAARN